MDEQKSLKKIMGQKKFLFLMNRLKLWDENKGIKFNAEKLGIKIEAAEMFARRYQLTYKKERVKIEEILSTVKHLRSEGKSLKEIAAILHVNKMTVHRATKIIGGDIK